jgi:hypothetical protein
MTLQELRKILKDKNLRIEYNTSFKFIGDTYYDIDTFFKVYTKVKLINYTGSFSHGISKDELERSKYKDYTDFFINYDFKKHYEYINQMILDHYIYCQKSEYEIIN